MNCKRKAAFPSAGLKCRPPEGAQGCSRGRAVGFVLHSPVSTRAPASSLIPPRSGVGHKGAEDGSEHPGSKPCRATVCGVGTAGLWRRGEQGCAALPRSLALQPCVPAAQRGAAQLCLFLLPGCRMCWGWNNAAWLGRGFLRGALRREPTL